MPLELQILILVPRILAGKFWSSKQSWLFYCQVAGGDKEGEKKTDYSQATLYV